MSTIVLILFFIALISLTVMIMKRIMLIRAGAQIIVNDDPYLPPVHEVRDILIQSTKQYSLIMISIALRTSIRTYVLLRKKGKELTHHIVKRYSKNSAKIMPESKEVNRFLKGISEYKKRIKHIKERIIEEETSQ